MKRCFRVLLWLVLLSPLNKLAAQFNDSVFHYLKYSTTGILNNTNDRKSFVLTNALSYTLQKDKITLNNNHTYIYGRQDGALMNNDYTTNLNFDVLKTTHTIYYWGLAGFTSSKSLNIYHQLQAGAGVGVNIFKGEQVELVVTNGVLYENSSILNTSQAKENYQTVRNSLRIKHAWAITSEISFEGSHFWQPSLKDSHDYIIRSSTAVNIKLRKWLSFSTGLTYNKISRTDRENLLLNIGLVAAGHF